ncbi:centrosomal protein of 170 kDa-like [Mixophyes fleayi]|uniref:centrosomal protein of 170 kDa-like n=1 Tax=Mixophyes fleayi TaxID=3061075 RepID=UPI003F4DBF5C
MGRLNSMYPFQNKDMLRSCSVPKVDSAIADLSSRTTLPCDNGEPLKDAMDRRMETSFRKLHISSGITLKSGIAMALVSRALRLWASTLHADIKDRINRLYLLKSLEVMQKSIDFLCEAMLDTIVFSSKSMASAVVARRSLWLRPWAPDRQLKIRLTTLPCEGTPENKERKGGGDSSPPGVAASPLVHNITEDAAGTSMAVASCKLQIFQDLAPSTIVKRQDLKEITAALRDRGYRYRWGFPFRLVVEVGSSRVMIENLEEGRKFLHQIRPSPGLGSCKYGKKFGEQMKAFKEEAMSAFCREPSYFEIPNKELQQRSEVEENAIFEIPTQDPQCPQVSGAGHASFTIEFDDSSPGKVTIKDHVTKFMDQRQKGKKPLSSSDKELAGLNTEMIAAESKVADWLAQNNPPRLLKEAAEDDAKSSKSDVPVYLKRLQGNKHKDGTQSDYENSASLKCINKTNNLQDRARPKNLEQRKFDQKSQTGGRQQDTASQTAFLIEFFDDDHPRKRRSYSFSLNASATGPEAPYPIPLSRIERVKAASANPKGLLLGLQSGSSSHRLIHSTQHATLLLKLKSEEFCTSLLFSQNVLLRSSGSLGHRPNSKRVTSHNTELSPVDNDLKDSHFDEKTNAEEINTPEAKDVVTTSSKKLWASQWTSLASIHVGHDQDNGKSEANIVSSLENGNFFHKHYLLAMCFVFSKYTEAVMVFLEAKLRDESKPDEEPNTPSYTQDNSETEKKEHIKPLVRQGTFTLDKPSSNVPIELIPHINKQHVLSPIFPFTSTNNIRERSDSVDTDSSLDTTFLLKDTEAVMVFLEAKLRDESKPDEEPNTPSYTQDNSETEKKEHIKPLVRQGTFTLDKPSSNVPIELIPHINKQHVLSPIFPFTSTNNIRERSDSVDTDSSLDTTFLLKDTEAVMVFLEAKLRDESKPDEEPNTPSYTQDNSETEKKEHIKPLVRQGTFTLDKPSSNVPIELIPHINKQHVVSPIFPFTSANNIRERSDSVDTDSSLDTTFLLKDTEAVMAFLEAKLRDESKPDEEPNTSSYTQDNSISPESDVDIASTISFVAGDSDKKCPQKRKSLNSLHKEKSSTSSPSKDLPNSSAAVNRERKNKTNVKEVATRTDIRKVLKTSARNRPPSLDLTDDDQTSSLPCTAVSDILSSDQKTYSRKPITKAQFTFAEDKFATSKASAAIKSITLPRPRPTRTSLLRRSRLGEASDTEVGDNERASVASEVSTSSTSKQPTGKKTISRIDLLAQPRRTRLSSLSARNDSQATISKGSGSSRTAEFASRNSLKTTPTPDGKSSPRARANSISRLSDAKAKMSAPTHSSPSANTRWRRVPPEYTLTSKDKFGSKRNSTKPPRLRASSTIKIQRSQVTGNIPVIPPSGTLNASTFKHKAKEQEDYIRDWSAHLEEKTRIGQDLALIAREINDVAGEIDSVTSSGTAPSTTVSTAATTPGSAIDTREEVGDLHEDIQVMGDSLLLSSVFQYSQKIRQTIDKTANKIRILFKDQERNWDEIKKKLRSESEIPIFKTSCVEILSILQELKLIEKQLQVINAMIDPDGSLDALNLLGFGSSLPASQPKPKRSSSVPNVSSSISTRCQMESRTSRPNIVLVSSDLDGVESDPDFSIHFNRFNPDGKEDSTLHEYRS